MPSKRVLILGNYPPPFGGVPRHIEYLVPHLASEGFEVHVLSGGNSGVREREWGRLYKYRKVDHGVSMLRHARCTTHTRRRYFSSFRVATEMRQILRFLSFISLGRRIIRLNNINIIKAYNLSTYGPVGAVLSREHSIPLVVSNFGEYFSKPAFFQRHLDLVKFTAQQATRRLCMTRHCGQTLARCGIDLPVEIVPYGIDTRAFQPKRTGALVRKGLGIPASGKVILFLARMNEEMGLHTFLDAMRVVLHHDKSIYCVIAGKKDSAYRHAVALTRQFPRNAFVCADVPLPELPDLYASSTVVAIPTEGDRACGSLVAAEAGACGKPVVATRAGGVPEFVNEDATGLLVPPNNHEALANALLRICRDEELATALGSAGRVWVEGHFDKDQTNRRIAEVLHEEIERHARGNR